MQRRFSILFAFFATALAIVVFGCPVGALAAWPDKPVRLIAVGTPGATADTVARVLAEGLRQATGQPFVVELKPGGSGVIGMSEVLRSPKDGYTFMVAINALVSEIPYSIKLPFDPAKEFRPIAELVQGGLVLIGSNSIPANNLTELLAWLRARPQGADFASYSAGTLSHVMGLQLSKATGIPLNHIPYKGSTPALQDVIAGHVPIMFDFPVTAVPMITSGKVKAYAMSSPQRSNALQDVPTFAEEGLPEIAGVAWIGLWSAANVPQPVQDRLRAETLKVLAQPSVRERFDRLGLNVGRSLSQDELARGLSSDYERIGEVLRSINYKPEGQ